MRTGLGRRAVAIAAGAALAWMTAAMHPASATAAASGMFGKEGTVKVRIPKRLGVTPEWAPGAAGGALVADYESFMIAEFPAGAVPAIEGAEVLVDENRILLNAGALDTTLPAVKALQGPVGGRGNFEGRTLHLIQFAGPIQPAWLGQLSQTGVDLVTYLATNSYLVYGDARQITALQAMAAASPQVQWEAAYLDSYKLDPGAVAMMADKARAGATDQLFAIQLVRDPAANQQTLAVINLVRSGPILSEYDILNYHNVVVAVPPRSLAMVAAQPEVVSIQPYSLPVLFDERQDQIVAGHLTGNVPSGPGYLSWLLGQGFTQAQFDSSAFVVDVSDTSIDQGNTSPNHFGLHTGGQIAGASRVMYAREIAGTNVTTPSPFHGCDGHGNINAHIICGYDDSSGFPFADSSGYHYGLGVAPFARVGSSVIFTSSEAYTNPNFTTLQSNAYNSGARISSNSWGAALGGQYNTDAQTYDALVRDAQPSGAPVPAPGNQEMVIVFAAGNAGPGTQSIGAPGTAKNVITVGAAENVQAFGGADGSGVDDSGADSANDIINFSSRGPCADQRKKPDICAPGTHVSGGVAQASPVITPTGQADACYSGGGVSGGPGGSHYWPSSPTQQYYTASSGTSHSTPCVAGGAALVRQFFINQGMAVPSPAMTKALLMNAARYMTGTSANDTLWSNNQGMGEMNLTEVFNRGLVTPTIFRDELAEDLFTASGQTRVFSGVIADSGRPFRVTLAWTDAPGPTSGSAFKNNLDLTVQIGANTYRGNVFSGANSTTGGAADTRNNVESVFLPAGASGAFTVTVTATNINSDGVPNTGGALDQDFALVIANASTGGCIAASVAVDPAPQAACAGSPATFAVVPGGTGPFTYQWRRNTSPIGGATGPSYTIASVSAGDVAAYDCVVTNDCGTATSNAASLTVNAGPSISTQPTSQTGCPGGSATFTVVADGTPAPTYQWRKNGTVLAGRTSASLTISPVHSSDGGTYDCIVTNPCGLLTSSPATLTLGVLPLITTQPIPATVCAGARVTFTSGANGFPAPALQWRHNGADIPGATAGSYTISSAAAGDAGSYDCVATNTCGSATSNAALLTVNSAPAFSTQPVSHGACAGSSTTFTAAAAGTPTPMLQWRRAGVNIPGATGGTLTLNPVSAADNGVVFDCVATNGCGSRPSTGATLTVNTGPTIATQPHDQSACDGGSVSLTVAAGGTPAPSYQWRRGGTPLVDGGEISGATTSTLTINPIGPADLASYDVVVSNSCGSVPSTSATISGDAAPVVTQDPVPQIVVAPAAASFTVAATGSGPLSYHWRREGTPLTDGGHISGALTASLTVSPTSQADAGGYDVVVANGCGPTTSGSASLTVYCAADRDRDGSIQPADIALLVNQWFADLENGTLIADYDRNGAVEPADIAAFVGDWFAEVANGC